MTAEKTCNSAGIISLLFPAGPSSPKTMPCNPALLSPIRPNPGRRRWRVCKHVKTQHEYN